MFFKLVYLKINLLTKIKIKIKNINIKNNKINYKIII